MHAGTSYDATYLVCQIISSARICGWLEGKNTSFYQICLELSMATSEEGRDLIVSKISEKDSSSALSCPICRYVASQSSIVIL